MSRWSGRRGQVEPLAAIVAVFAVGAGLALYAGALSDALPGRADASAQPTLDSVERAVSDDGAVEPSQLSSALDAVAGGHRLNLTLVTHERQWTVGATPPSTARNATTRVGVRTAPGTVRPGRLTVRVWP